LVIGLVIALGLIGFIDDYLKISRKQSLGLTGKQKLLAQALIASLFGYLGIQFADLDGLTPISLNLSTVRDTSLVLGPVLVVIWVALMVMATSNGVNLTDGLDGLASGASVMTFLAFVLIGVWEFGQSCAITSRSAGFSSIGSGICRIMYWIPMVERFTCKDIYGRHRFIGTGRSTRRTSDNTAS
jgi:phospho-N-acetylmuramoyl-pentapeptide-transferase